MSQHEVEVKPYGTKNEVETRVYTSGNKTTEAETVIKPPYGQKNEATAPVGSRMDVEVKPFGTQDVPRETVLKPQRTATTTVRSMNLEQWRNPLLATLLGITLALTLLSLSYLPRAVSNVWHWGTNWGSHSPSKSHEAYETVTKSFPHTESLYQQGKDMINQRTEQASRMVQDAKETVNDMSGETLLHKAKVTGENILESAKETLSGGSIGSMTQEAKRMACHKAQQAKDMACQGVDMSQWSSSGSTINRAQESAADAQNRASGLYQKAKQTAENVLQAAKDTVTYPLHAAQDAVSATSERIQAARETVMNTGSNIGSDIQAAGDQARDATYSKLHTAEDTASQTLQAAKDTLQGAKDSVKDTVLGAKDTVLGAGQAAKDTVLNAGQAAKDTVIGAGEAAKNLAENAVHGVKETVRGVKDTVTGGFSSSESTTTIKEQPRGPTRVKVEVTEL